MPATASVSSLVTRTRVDHASSRAAPGRPFRVGSDGLPLLPCHDAPVSVAPASSPPSAVALFGHVDTKQSVRTQLLARYSHSQQIDQLSEMTLRIDTELELLRRSCFAQRNAQWGNITPDLFEYKPTPTDMWAPQPANDKLLLRKMKMDGTLDGSGREFYPPDKAHDKEVMEFVRDRPWPPQEFALKPVAKPSRGRGGKRKAAPMAAVLEPVPLLAKTCRECKTQSTPLWRTQTRTVKVKKQVLKTTTGTDVATNLANAFVAQSMVKMEPQKTEIKMVDEKIEVDLCLNCYLKLERADLFDKKRIEKKKQERRKKDQAAAAALLEKKRLKHQIHLLKKHKKQEMLAAQQAGDEQVVEQVVEEAAAPAAVILKFTREEIEAATASSKERKKDRKHSRKDKKKKKKKHRRQREHHEDSESDCPTPIPSPAQMNGYVYADRAPEPYTTPQTSAFEDAPTERVEPMAVNVSTEPEALDRGFHEVGKEVATPARSSSRKRKSVQYTEPTVVVESPASASKKRKTSSSRTSRPKRTAASATPTPVAPVVVAAPPTSSAKKRSRTKKELARERELRALGQYCPVCNEVYEDDDQNTFVCCDSCELWVHGACDPSLTPAIITTMANTEDKYICPLCAGR